MTVACVWEFAHHDSPAEVALASATLASLATVMAVHVAKIARAARRSAHEYDGCAALLLYSDVRSMYTRGFLHAPFRASRAWFVGVGFVHALGKAAVVAGVQEGPVGQAAGLFAFDVAMFVAVAASLPGMDRAVNVVHVAVAAAGVVNSTLLLLFSNCFGLPVTLALFVRDQG